MQPGSWEAMRAEADGQRGPGCPSSQPFPTLAGYVASHWLLGEGLFVSQDKEEIEKFLMG